MWGRYYISLVASAVAVAVFSPKTGALETSKLIA